MLCRTSLFIVFFCVKVTFYKNFTSSRHYKPFLLVFNGIFAFLVIPARVTFVLWWFGVMIVIATYTANLAAFLTVSRSHTSIASIEDLGAQTKVQYGEPFSFFPRHTGDNFAVSKKILSLLVILIMKETMVT